MLAYEKRLKHDNLKQKIEKINLFIDKRYEDTEQPNFRMIVDTLNREEVMKLANRLLDIGLDEIRNFNKECVETATWLKRLAIAMKNLPLFLEFNWDYSHIKESIVDTLEFFQIYKPLIVRNIQKELEGEIYE